MNQNARFWVNTKKSGLDKALKRFVQVLNTWMWKKLASRNRGNEMKSVKIGVGKVEFSIELG